VPYAGPTFVGILPNAGLKYYIYEELKLKIPEDRQDSIAMRLSCGALAGLFGQTFTYPLDVVRRQMQVTLDSNRSVMKCSNVLILHLHAKKIGKKKEKLTLSQHQHAHQLCLSGSTTMFCCIQIFRLRMWYWARPGSRTP